MTVPDAPGSSRSIRLCRVVLPVSWGLCVLATVVGLADAGFTALCAPFIFVLGLVLIGGGWSAGSRRTVVLGACHCAICLLVFALTRLSHWSPRQSQGPFVLIGAIYTAVTASSMRQARKELPRFAWWQCRRCGFALFGLTRPRCPECGQGFHPAMLAALAPPANRSAERTDDTGGR